jgi:hypothetical protein
MSERTRNWLLFAAFIACFLIVGWIDDPDDYAPIIDTPITAERYP